MSVIGQVLLSNAIPPAPVHLRVLKAVSLQDFLKAGSPIVDVRSPGEFARGHIPGAFSLPLFTDAERAAVGTIYKKEGRDAAVLEGLRAVGPRMASIVEMAVQVAPQKEIRVHCWRGGERSSSVAWLLSKAGFKEVITLIGGYKVFRRHVVESFDQQLDLRILGGYTGSGKTLLLHQLKERGEQIIDLEALACHKGSSFGALGQAPQPTTEHFENSIWAQLQEHDRTKTIWIEDESMMIGRARIPNGLYAQMRKAPLLFLEMSLEERAGRLVAEYGVHSRIELAQAIERIAKRLGPQHAKTAIDALGCNDLWTVAMITLNYYDKAYLRGAAERDPAKITRIPMGIDDPSPLFDQLRTNVITSS